MFYVQGSSASKSFEWHEWEKRSARERKQASFVSYEEDNGNDFTCYIIITSIREIWSHYVSKSYSNNERFLFIIVSLRFNITTQITRLKIDRFEILRFSIYLLFELKFWN
jgi:hypothetical protein